MRMVLVVVLLLVAGCSVAVPGRAVPEPARPSTVPATASLVPDVLPDECLLDAEGFALLLEAPVDPPVTGGEPRSCATTATRGTPRALAAVNVYGVRGGAPTDLLSSGRPLGIGDAAVLVDTASGRTLQVAAGAHLITIAVAEREPTAQRWVEAGRRAVAALG